VTIYDDPHIYQTIEGRPYKTSLGGSITSYAIGSVNSQLAVVEDLAWWIFRRCEIHVGGDIIVPDLAGWRHERMSHIPNVEYFELAPDWVLEIVTPETALLVRKHKLTAYAQWGVEYAWIADPAIRTLDLFRLVDGRWHLIAVYGDDELPGLAPFESVELKLSRLWIPSTPEA
jgi:Uma2 family endonuclease